MKNKKGFTLVELLAVIVILALIMGVAVVSIGNVLQESKETVMFENAQSVIDGVKKQFAIKIESPNGRYYGFSSSLLSQGGVQSPLGGNFVYRSLDGENGDVEVTTGLWRLGTTPQACAAGVPSYISVDSNGKFTICLTAGAGQKYITGTEDQIAARTASCIK